MISKEELDNYKGYADLLKDGNPSIVNNLMAATAIRNLVDECEGLQALAEAQREVIKELNKVQGAECFVGASLIQARARLKELEKEREA